MPEDAETPSSGRLEILLAALLDRLESGGPAAAARMLADHPREAPHLLRRLRTLAAMGLIALDPELLEGGELEAGG